MAFVATILAPIIALMQDLYRIAFFVSDDLVWSVVLLSIFFNFVTLPVYYLSETLQKRGLDAKKRMDDEILSIKKYYTGRERHFYVQAVHRRYGHSLGKATVASLGLLIQIPFFFSAYYFLHNSPNFNGVHFWGIDDMSQPDTLLFGFPLLPFIMLLANMLSVHIFDKGKSNNNAWQLWAMGLVFFALLYNEAAILLVFWTTSNLFSIAKNVCASPAVRLFNRSIAMFASLIAGSCIAGRESKRLGLLLVSLFLVALVVYGVFDGDRGATYAGLLLWIAMHLMLALIGVVSYRYFYVRTGQQNTLFALIVKMFLFIAFVLYVLDVYLVFFASHATSNRVNIYLRDAMMGVLAIVLIMFVVSYVLTKVRPVQHVAISSRFFFMTVGAFFLIFQVVNPLLLYNDAPDDFFVMPGQLTFSVLSTWVACVFWVTGIYIGSSKVSRGVLAMSMVLLLVVALLYSFVFVHDFGEMNQFTFIETPAFYNSLLEPLLLVLLCVALAYVLVHAKRTVGIFVTCVFVSLSGFVFVNLPSYAVQEEAMSAGAVDFSTETAHMMGLSNQKNLVVFWLDGFSGSQMDAFFTKEKSLLAPYTGFTWYKNTLSQSLSTSGSIAAMVGGSKYTVDAINAKPAKAIGSVYNDAYREIPKRFFPEGWKIAYFNPQHAELLPDGVYASKYDYAKHYLSAQQPEFSGELASFAETNMLYMVSLFRSSPFFLKPTIYDDAHWQGQLGEKIKRGKVYKKAASWGMLHELSKSLHANASQKSLLFFQLELPHTPNHIGANGKLVIQGVPYAVEARAGLTAVGKVLRRMQELGVYDKSKIVVVSDHGWNKGYTSRDFDKNFVRAIAETPGKTRPNRLHALLMVKDYGEQGDVQQSDRFMSNADMFAIICHGLEKGCDEGIADPTKGNEDRTLHVFSTKRPSLSDQTFEVLEAYSVKNNIFDPENWGAMDLHKLNSNF